MSYRSDYIGVHAPKYESIAKGEREGWSSAEETEDALSHVQRALKLPGMPAGGLVLELGCGDGCLSVELARHTPFEVHGVEIVPLALQLARRRADAAGVKLQLHEADVRALPWTDGAFDLAVDSHCLHCIVLNDRALVLAEVRRVLRPGGALIVMTMTGDPPAEMRPGFDPATRTAVRDGVAGRHFGTAESVAAELRAAGFTIADHWTVPALDAACNDEWIAVCIR
jgi:ubiquinone/menaquinone biosynthesis C-methylase UbiE